MVWLTAWWCTRERHRWTLLVLTAVMVAFAVALPDSAEASSVGLASVHLSSTAAGATRVHYTVGFRTSGSGALTANTSTIDLQAPAGTAFPSGATDYTIIDLTTGERAFAAQVVVIGPGSTAVTLKTAINIGARDAVQIEIAGVTNTSATGGH